MPAKRRTSKSRYVAPWGAVFSKAQLWRSTFSIGFDGLGFLRFVAGIETDNMRPPRELTQDAWNRLGADFLAAREPGKREPWALREFGPPQG